MSKLYTILIQGQVDIEAHDDISEEALFILAKKYLIRDGHYDLEFVLEGSQDIEDEGVQDNE